MTIIAMTREMGSLGKDVAAELARRRQLEVIHQELVESDLARKMDIGESEVHRFLEGRKARFWEKSVDDKKISRLTRVEVLELAERGNVIIRGWGATHLLRTIPHIPCIRICAPMELRIERMMERLGVDDRDQVRQEIVTNDDAHDRVARRLFGADWMDPTLYDLVMSTERLTIENCVDQIEGLLALDSFAESEGTAPALEEALLTARIQSAVIDNAPHYADSRLITVGIKDGQIVLEGGVQFADSMDAAIDVVSSLAGEREIVNRLWCSNRLPLS